MLLMMKRLSIIHLLKYLITLITFRWVCQEGKFKNIFNANIFHLNYDLLKRAFCYFNTIILLEYICIHSRRIQSITITRASSSCPSTSLIWRGLRYPFNKMLFQPDLAIEMFLFHFPAINDIPYSWYCNRGFGYICRNYNHPCTTIWVMVEYLFLELVLQFWIQWENNGIWNFLLLLMLLTNILC